MGMGSSSSSGGSSSKKKVAPMITAERLAILSRPRGSRGRKPGEPIDTAPSATGKWLRIPGGGISTSKSLSMLDEIMRRGRQTPGPADTAGTVVPTAEEARKPRPGESTEGTFSKATPGTEDAKKAAHDAATPGPASYDPPGTPVRGTKFPAAPARSGYEQIRLRAEDPGPCHYSTGACFQAVPTRMYIDGPMRGQ